MRTQRRTFGTMSLLCAALACGCARNEYAITLQFDSDASLGQAASVEVYVLPACSIVPAPGDEPPTFRPVEVLNSRDGTMPLGDVDAGMIAIYARARDTTCAVYAAGCQDFAVASGGTGVLTVPIRTLASSGGACDPGNVCVAGLCLAGGDAAFDGGLDATADTGSE